MHKCRVVFNYQHGVAPSDVLIAGPGSQGVLVVDGRQVCEFSVPDPSKVIGKQFTFATSGCWIATVNGTQFTNRTLTVDFFALPRTGPLGWWHSLHRVGNVAHEPKIRIGVVDEALAKQSTTSCIAHVSNDGGAAWGGGNAQRAFQPMTDHGQAVCSLLTSRARTSDGFAGIVPGAKVFFAAAGSDSSSKLSMRRLRDALDYLATARGCDIITVSAGDHEGPLAGIEAIVEALADRGVLCFFAAGNSRVPYYPAKYQSCLAVAALGRHGIAPRGTVMDFRSSAESEALANNSADYLWAQSARGPEVDFCAAGVGVIWNRLGKGEREAAGTSFASPVAAGVAAVILSKDATFLDSPRDRSRYNLALRLLQSSSTQVTDTQGKVLWKYGLPRL